MQKGRHDDGLFPPSDPRSLASWPCKGPSRSARLRMLLRPLVRQGPLFSACLVQEEVNQHQKHDQRFEHGFPSPGAAKPGRPHSGVLRALDCLLSLTPSIVRFRPFGRSNSYTLYIFPLKRNQLPAISLFAFSPISSVPPSIVSRGLLHFYVVPVCPRA